MRILFRADASPAMGTGHVMRCLALAQALRDLGHECHVASAPLPPRLAARLEAEAIIRHDLPDWAGSRDGAAAGKDARQTLYRASGIGAAALVVDGYHFDDAWRASIHAGCRAEKRPVLALIDDATGPVPHADLVLNPAAPERPDSPGCLFGSGHVLLRREIRQAVPAPLAARDHILVSFGGSDPKALTVPVSLALARMLRADRLMPGAVSLCVVLGGAVPEADRLVAALAVAGDGVRIHRDVRDMGVLMARAGLAISAGGGTLGELAALGVPSLVVTVADNQIAGAAAAERAGWCLTLSGDAVSPDVIAGHAVALWRDLPRRLNMTVRARGLVDGQGAIRVANALIAASYPGVID